MKFKLRSPEYWTLVYCLVKFLGLAPFTVKNNRFYPPTLLGKIYPLFFTASYLFFTSTVLSSGMGQIQAANHSLFIKILRTTMHFTSLPCSISTQILFLFMYKKIVRLMNEHSTISKVLKSLSIEEDHKKYFKNIFTTTVLANAILIAAFVMIFLMEPYWNIFITMKYCINNWIGFNTFLIFTQLLIFIRQRFTLVNKELCNLILIPADHQSSPHHSRIFAVSRDKACNENEPKNQGPNDLQFIWKIEALHWQLSELVDQTVHLFAIPIILHSVRLFSVLTLGFYGMYSDFRDFRQLCYPAILLKFLCSGLRVAIAIVALSIITYGSVKTCEQRNATKALLFRVWSEAKSVELKDEVFMFSHQLLHTPIVVSIFGLVDLDYSFIFKIFCSVATYLIMVIQFEI